MEPQIGIVYKIDYKTHELEGIFLGYTSNKANKRCLILLNICPEAEKLPEHFPLISVNSLKIEHNKMIYETSGKRIVKINENPLEQKALNEYGKKIWKNLN